MHLTRSETVHENNEATTKFTLRKTREAGRNIYILSGGGKHPNRLSSFIARVCKV